MPPWSCGRWSEEFCVHFQSSAGVDPFTCVWRNCWATAYSATTYSKRDLTLAVSRNMCPAGSSEDSKSISMLLHSPKRPFISPHSASTPLPLLVSSSSWLCPTPVDYSTAFLLVVCLLLFGPWPVASTHWFHSSKNLETINTPMHCSPVTGVHCLVGQKVTGSCLPWERSTWSWALIWQPHCLDFHICGKSLSFQCVPATWIYPWRTWRWLVQWPGLAVVEQAFQCLPLVMNSNGGLSYKFVKKITNVQRNLRWHPRRKWHGPPPDEAGGRSFCTHPCFPDITEAPL